MGWGGPITGASDPHFRIRAPRAGGPGCSCCLSLEDNRGTCRCLWAVCGHCLRAQTGSHQHRPPVATCCSVLEARVVSVSVLVVLHLPLFYTFGRRLSGTFISNPPPQSCISPSSLPHPWLYLTFTLSSSHLHRSVTSNCNIAAVTSVELSCYGLLDKMLFSLVPSLKVVG